MGKLLFANIGNRNITFKGKFISNHLSENSGALSENFREFTKELLVDFEKHEADLSPMIIDELLNKKNSEISRVCLISSDMEGIEERTDQDTLYEGELLCRLFSKKYPAVRFENKIMKCSVFDHDELIKFYRPLLASILKDEEFAGLVYCDAGGTSQQKFSSKILIEYMFPPKQVETWYIAQTTKGKSKLQPGSVNEYRKIIDLEQIRTLVLRSEYEAAISLGGSNFKPIQRQLLELAFYKFNLAHETVAKTSKGLLHNFKKHFEENEFLIHSRDMKPRNEVNDLKEVLEEKDIYKMQEILQLAKRNESLKRYSFAVLAFQQFIEFFLDKVNHGLGYNRANLNISPDNILAKFPGFPKLYPGLNIVSANVPVRIAIASYSDNELSKTILNHIQRTNSFYKLCGEKISYLDTKRNKFAHEGRMVSENQYFEMSFLDDLNEICRIFKVENENSYEILNNLILEQLL